MAKRGNRIPLMDHWNTDHLGGAVETEITGAHSQGMDGDVVRGGFFHDPSHLGINVLSRFHPHGPCDEGSG